MSRRSVVSQARERRGEVSGGRLREAMAILSRALRGSIAHGSRNARLPAHFAPTTQRSLCLGLALPLRVCAAPRMRQLDVFERRDRGAVDHLSVRVEARAVARTVPALLRTIPFDDALE